MRATLSRAIVLCLMLLATSVLLANSRREEPAIARSSFASFPETIQAWHSQNAAPLEKEVLAVLGVDDYLTRVYYKPGGAVVGLYMGFWGSQRQGDTIHSPLNCLPGSGWEPVSEGRATITNVGGTGRNVEINRYIVQKGLDRQVVLYWYQSHGRVVASEYWSRFYLIHDAIRMNRTDGSLVRVIAPMALGAADGGDAAAHVAEDFVNALFPLLPSYLPE